MAAGLKLVTLNPRSPQETIIRNLRSAEAISSKSTFIYSGPPCIEIESDENDVVVVELYKIGLAPQFGMAVNSPVQPIMEIGSSRQYLLRDRALYGINLAKVLIDRHSLAKILYSYYLVFDPDTQELTDQLNPAKFPGGQAPAIPPNSGGDFFDLASDLFDHPFGLFVQFSNYLPNESGDIGQPFSQWYIENVYIQGLQRGVTAGSAIIVEGGAFRVDRFVPIPLKPIEIPPAACIMGSEWTG